MLLKQIERKSNLWQCFFFHFFLTGHLGFWLNTWGGGNEVVFLSSNLLNLLR